MRALSQRMGLSCRCDIQVCSMAHKMGATKQARGLGDSPIGLRRKTSADCRLRRAWHASQVVVSRPGTERDVLRLSHACCAVPERGSRSEFFLRRRVSPGEEPASMPVRRHNGPRCRPGGSSRREAEKRPARPNSRESHCSQGLPTRPLETNLPCA